MQHRVVVAGVRIRQPRADVFNLTQPATINRRVFRAAGDNAAMESFFSLLQKNVLDRRAWVTRDELRFEIATWIEPTCHRRCRQAGLCKPTPVEYETIMTPNVALAA